MSSLVKALSLFPYTRLWRVGGKPFVSHTCGGLASLFVITVIVAILVIQLVQVFNLSNVTISTLTSSLVNIPLTNLTTTQNNQTMTPFMFAIRNQVDGLATGVNYTFTAAYFPPSTAPSTPINLTPCTQNHFSQLPDLANTFNTLGLSAYSCLPLNQNYLLGGNSNLNFGELSIKIACPSTSNCSLNKFASAYFFTWIANPSNYSNPWTTNLFFATLTYPTVYTIYTYGLNLDTLVADNNLWPFQNAKQTSQSMELDNAIGYFPINGQTPIQLQIQISLTQKLTTINRSYMKVLDAISYVGGIFNVLIGLFIFMESYGAAFFEMVFAAIYFKSKDAFSFGFLSFFKYLTYNLLIMIRCKPDWRLAQKWRALRESVGRLLDVVYLQQRIQFLETAMTVLLEEHQLKGIHLIRGQTQKQSDQNYKKHRLRDQIIRYFRQKDKEKYQHKQQLNQQQMEVKKSGLEIKVLASNDPPVVHPAESIGSSQFLNPGLQKQINFKSQNNSPEKMVRMNSSLHPFSANQYRQSEQLNCIEEEQETYVQQLDQDQIKEFPTAEIAAELQNDLRKLVLEAKNGSIDNRSKRIFDRINKQLKQWLKNTVKEQERQQLNGGRLSD